jgi:hypothetical protein
MFTKSLDEAKKNWREYSFTCSIVMFGICLEGGKVLFLYTVTDSCLLAIFENIRVWRRSLLEYCVSEKIDYAHLLSVSYVE